ncbi:glycosyltransferase [Vibrio hannami]|uniref:glycosyltransferase n=1 Tax=Vibrio hannami TaxID=2717094 RepID=UPI00240F6BC5|nr:glycosyltransferase [Vibrio hannami]MDG3088645.1 glycosyltransferase [Vibrio hannami]
MSSALFQKVRFFLRIVSFGRLKTLYRLLKNEPPSHVLKQVTTYLSAKGKIDGYLFSSSVFDNSHYIVDLEQPVDLPIVAPKHDRVQVSIIIPVYNQWEYTARCVESVVNSVKGVSYEIILADDCSDDETRNAAKLLENVNIIRAESNQGFLLNCNNAAKQARGDYIVFLNNDTYVHEGWLEALVDVAEKDTSVGLVGSKLVYEDGTLQEAGGIVWRDASAWNYGNGDNPGKPEYNYLKSVDYVSGASILVRRSCWEELEGFDTRYVPAYYEDTDFAFALADKGYKVIYQPKSVVTHFEGKSHGTSTTSGLKAYQKVNQKKFRSKWQHKLSHAHMPHGQNIFQARDRSTDSRTILIIDHYVPWFDQDAGSRSTFMYIQFFLNQGYHIKFIGDNFYPHQPYTDILEQMGVEVLYGNEYANNWQGWFLANHSCIDVVYLHRPHIAPNYLDFIKENSSAKVLYQCHDLHHWRFERAAEVDDCDETREKAKEWYEKELALFDSVDVGLTFSMDEKHYLEEQGLSCAIEQIPLFLYDKPMIKDCIPNFNERSDFMFVGGFNHSPNSDGVLWFLNEVFPQVLEVIPDIKFHIIGSKMPDSIKKFESENVVIHGYVSDQALEQLYRTVKVNIVPLRHGAGVKGKLIESFYFGTPTVSTAVGVEGIDAERFGLIGFDKPDTFACELINLLSEEKSWVQHQTKQSQLFEQSFLTSSQAERLKSVF